MARLKDCLRDVLAALKATNKFATVRVWNNQIRQSKEGKTYIYPTPAAFVEVVNDAAFEVLGQGFESADLAFIIHIEHEYYDAQDGTFEQDLEVFGLRDDVVIKLHRFKPAGCGPLVKRREQQDFDHDNIYHYAVTFLTHFIDSTGSPFDAERHEYMIKEPPTELVLNAEIKKEIPGAGVIAPAQFMIPKNR